MSESQDAERKAPVLGPKQSEMVLCRQTYVTEPDLALVILSFFLFLFS